MDTEKKQLKNKMGQLKCNSSKSGIYRIISTKVYIKIMRITLVFFPLEILVKASEKAKG